MTVRTPVYWDGTSIAEMSAGQILKIKNRCVYLHGDATYRSVDLLVDGVGTSIRRMIDSRDIAGAATSNATSMANNNAHISSNPAIDAGATTTYDKISLSAVAPSDPGDPNNINYPLFYDGNGVLQTMTQNDMYDTFINDATDTIIDGTDRDGTYRIYTDTSGLPNHTLINATPVFTDQQFNKAIHGSVEVTSELEILPLSSNDLPVTEQNYYLWRTDQTAGGDYTLPLFFNTDNQFETKDSATIDTLLGNLLGFSTASRTNYRIGYDVEGVGTDSASISVAANTPAGRGSSITDTTLNADVRINDQDGANTYRSQNLPTGGNETETTYTLKIYRY